MMLCLSSCSVCWTLLDQQWEFITLITQHEAVACLFSSAPPPEWLGGGDGDIGVYLCINHLSRKHLAPLSAPGFVQPGTAWTYPSGFSLGSASRSVSLRLCFLWAVNGLPAGIYHKTDLTPLRPDLNSETSAGILFLASVCSSHNLLTFSWLFIIRWPFAKCL